jgi:hypothetical protein
MTTQIAINQQDMVWECRACENYNCLHNDNCNKCSAFRQYQNPRTFAAQAPPRPVVEQADEETEDEVEVNEVAPSVSNNIISSSNIIIQEVPSSSSSSSSSRNGGRQYACDVCNKNFDSRNKLYYHKRIKHLDVSEERIKCGRCNHTYKKKSTFALQKHLIKQHRLSEAEAEAEANGTGRTPEAPVPSEAEVPILEPPTQEVMQQATPDKISIRVRNVANGKSSGCKISPTNVISALLKHIDDKYHTKGKLFKNNQELRLIDAIGDALINNEEIEYREMQIEC